jgi:hypothetical protein
MAVAHPQTRGAGGITYTMIRNWHAERQSGAHKMPVVLVALALFVGACVQTRPYATLSAAAEPLRSQFNKDIGHPRIMMLVAPT